MKTTYKRLNNRDRLDIEKLLLLGKNNLQISAILGVSPSTISRELKRVKDQTYDAFWAHCDSINKASSKKFGKCKILSNEKLRNYIYSKLKLYWSPEQISQMLKREFSNDSTMQVSHESIYCHVYVQPKKEVKQLLISQLRQKRNYRGNVRRGTDKRTTIKDAIRIDERPQEVATRVIPGHWEGDLILGKNRESAVGTLVERVSKFLILVHLKKRDSASVRKAFERAFKKLPSHLKISLTYDNGSEMAQHKLFTKNTKIKVYFTHPYSPWERGTNENTNGLIRDFLPKGTDLSIVKPKQIKQIQDWLNERPRKSLNFDTPLNTINKYYQRENLI